MRLNTNRILSNSRQNLNYTTNSHNVNVEASGSRNTDGTRNSGAQILSSPPFNLPYKLVRKNYGPGEPSQEQSVNEIVDNMSADHDNKLRKTRCTSAKKQNLSPEETKGLKWLENMTEENKIAVVPADKGGAILIVYPELLRKKVLEKLHDPVLYEKLSNDPTQELKIKALFHLKQLKT